MNEEERKCLNDCGFANVTQLLLAYVGLQQENAQLKELVAIETQKSVKRAKERDLYKSVIDEIREFAKELYDNTDDITCYDIDKNTKNDLLKILDKAKGSS